MITAVILAGGMGTRLRSTLPHLPKPMAPIYGRPFLEYQMDFWIGQGVSRFVVSVGFMKAVIMNHFKDSYRNTPIHYAIEERPLGTGGGLLLAAQNLSEAFLVLNGDTFFEVDLAKLLTFHSKTSSEWTFSLAQSDEVDRYMSIEIAADGEILRPAAGSHPQQRLVNGGVYLIKPSGLAKTQARLGQKLSLENDLLPAYLARGGKRYGIEFSGKFIDIGVPRDYFRAAELLQQRPEALCK